MGAGLVSQAHVFPCVELVYRPLDPPVHQSLHIRYPLGHTLTEPERYLAGLLIRERLSDPRYQATPLAEAQNLVRFADSDITEKESSPDSSQDTIIPFHTFHHAPPQVNLSTPLLKYIIAIVDEKSLTKAADMMEHIHSYRQGHGGSLYLQRDPVLAQTVRSEIVTAFHRQHPDAQLQVVESCRLEARLHVLQTLARAGTADTILPRQFLPPRSSLPVCLFRLPPVLLPPESPPPWAHSPGVREGAAPAFGTYFRLLFFYLSPGFSARAPAVLQNSRGTGYHSPGSLSIR